MKLAEELRRNQSSFIPDAVMGFAVHLDYTSSRVLFECE
jgi:hypothetical protein